MKKRLAIFASHVIQYQDPLFKRIAAHPEIDLTVIYGSKSGVEKFVDRDMGVELTWDLDGMLAGYRSVFLRNLSPLGLHRGPMRLCNPGIVPLLARERFDALITMAGWGTATSLLAYATCVATGTPYFLYGDSSFIPPDNGLRGWLRKMFLGWLFRHAAGFMTLGTMNADYYRHYGVEPARLFHMPYAIDNDRFREASRITDAERHAIRVRFGIPDELVLIHFSGKLIERKNPIHLIDALERMTRGAAAGILFMGDGPQRAMLEAEAQRRGLGERVFFTGFVNQTEIPKIIAACDIFALPSSFDPRGTVANEAMACGLPIVISDRVGIYGQGDLLRDGENGFVYPVGDNDALARRLDELVADPELRRRMGARSLEIISTWDFEADIRGIMAALQSLKRR